MEFDEFFSREIAELNSRRQWDSRLQDALRRYHGRSLVFKVRSDATYIFWISSEGVRYEVNPSSNPSDMYLEMDLGRAKRLVYQRSLGALDLPFIICRNITLADVEFAKKLFGGK